MSRIYMNVFFSLCRGCFLIEFEYFYKAYYVICITNSVFFTILKIFYLNIHLILLKCKSSIDVEQRFSPHNIKNVIK